MRTHPLPRTDERSLITSAVLGAVIGAVLWLLSGLAIGAIASVSNRRQAAIALVFPPTVPVDTWLQLSPWNVLIPALGALLFGGLSGMAYGTLLRWQRWRTASLGLMLLDGWIVSVVAAFLTRSVDSWQYDRKLVTDRFLLGIPFGAA